MRMLLVLSIVLMAVSVVCLSVGADRRAEAAEERGPMLAHNVYFNLKENSPAARKRLVDACKKHLANHPGEVFFAAGILAEQLNRPVNDRDFDVALHIVFKDLASHDKYQPSERHKRFIEENQDSWKKVRVFDSLVQK
jgi:hypothetical protein